MSYSQSGKEAFLSLVGWIIAGAVAPAIPNGLGVFIPIAGILASVSDIGQASGPALFGMVVTAFFSWVLQDQITFWLAVVAIVVGFASIVLRSGGGSLCSVL